MNDLASQLAATDANAPATPLITATPDTLETALGGLSETAQAFAAATNLAAAPGDIAILPNAKGAIEAVIAGAPALGDPFGPLFLGAVRRALPPGNYRLTEAVARPDLAALGWLLGGYRFDRYEGSNDQTGPAPCLICPDGAGREAVVRAARATVLARDLINTPANDMGPGELAGAFETLAREHNAQIEIIEGDKLLAHRLGLIHAVGRASARAPRLIDLRWGSVGPRVTLVGKGVCFDSGGLDLKPAAGMALMKKDMGGAANVAGLAAMIMGAELPVRLRVLVPAVENAIDGSAFRPGDVLTARSGTTVEIGNTDAEGRLVLADALDLADEEAPDLLIDMATLTGAARVALGPDLPPFYTHDNTLARDLDDCAKAQADPVWRLPLWQPYDGWVAGEVAQLTNAPAKPFAGSLTAALFLARFVKNAGAHIHLDIYGWAPEPRPQGPKGGEAQGVRALYSLIENRFGGG
ncbi:MAG: leucyl aminopeptidase family protein [Alphaproteobacteria bacterium]